MQEVFRHYGVEHFATWSDTKAAVVERFNRTLKSRLWQYFSANQTNIYVDVLDRVLAAYNNSYHRSIGMTPVQASEKRNEQLVWSRLYANDTGGGGGGDGRGGVVANKRGDEEAPGRAPPRSLNVRYGPTRTSHLRRLGAPPRLVEQPVALLRKGAMVRISNVKGVFEKGYVPNWSEEDFRIREVLRADARGERFRPRVIYKLEDRAGEPIKGSWYREELQSINSNRYLIERIIRKRRRLQPQEQVAPLRGNSEENTSSRSLPTREEIEEVLVKWKGWPTKFNTWIPADDLQRITPNFCAAAAAASSAESLSS